jgi:hypothetical protein
MENTFRKTLLAGVSALALVVGASSAFADAAATAVTQTATHSDAATFWIGQTAGLTACNAVSATSPSATITITPPAGQYVYLTDLIVQINTDATGSTAVPTVSTTNISTNGGATAGAFSLATTLSTTGATNTGFVLPFPIGGLKSAAPGVAVTFVPSATLSAHTIACMSATGYFNAN